MQKLLKRRSFLAAMLAPEAKIRPLTSGPKHHFFGYYGVAPWNRSGRKIACLEVGFQNRRPEEGEPATVGWVDAESGEFTAVTETRAWNHQQGAMLNWNPLDAEDEILFNDRDGAEVITAGWNLRTGRRRTWPRAIESVGANGRLATSVTYGRLMRLRPVVGYAGARDPYPEDNHPAGDGVWILDLKTGRTRLAVSLKQVYEHLAERHPELRDKALFVQHSVLNPGCERFFFLARILEKGQLVSAMFTAAADGSGLREVVPFGLGVSHFAWRSETEIAATFRQEGVMRHVLFHDGERDYRLIGPEFLKGDGHCTFAPGGEWMATDENVSKPPAKKLRLYHLGARRGVELGVFPMLTAAGENYVGGDQRCDLHPRWKRDGTAICFDALEERDWTRQLFVADVRAVMERGTAG
ncbi:MAG: hypothetical protein HY821_04800 [Acidobacteria bacterium]|nr:hypothetical protein [Acidobacteriota bacterium]